MCKIYRKIQISFTNLEVRLGQKVTSPDKGERWGPDTPKLA